MKCCSCQFKGAFVARGGGRRQAPNMQAASATNTATKMLILLVAAVAATAEALGTPRRLVGLAGNATDAAADDESALSEADIHFLSEDELREYLDEAVSGRQPPPASHPIRSVQSNGLTS